MSSIASFNILAIEKTELLVQESIVKTINTKQFLVFTKTELIDKYHEFLEANSEEAIFDNGSGYCFLSLELYFESIQKPIDSYFLPPNKISSELSKNRNSSIGVFFKTDAEATLAFIANNPIDKSSLKKFLKSEEEGEVSDEEVDITLSALAFLRFNLKLVTEKSFGIFSIG